MGLIFALFLIIAFGAVAYFDLTQTPGFNPATFSLHAPKMGAPAARVATDTTPPRPADIPVNDDHRPT